MEWYGWVITGGAILSVILVYIMKPFVAAVRKNDKIENTAKIVKQLKDDTKKIAELETKILNIESDLKAAFSKLDVRGVEIHEVREQVKAGFDEIRNAQGLMLEGLSVIIKALPEIKDDESVAKYMDKFTQKTTITVKG